MIRIGFMGVAFVAMTFGFAPPASPQSPGGCKAALQWTLTIRSTTTLEKLRKSLPRGVHASKAEWVEGDQAVGNAVAISGQLLGSVLFGTARSKNVEREHASMVLLYMSPKDMQNYNAGKDFDHCLKSINQLLRKQGQVSKMGDDYPPVSGRAAIWSVMNSRKLTLYEHWYGNGVTLMMDIKPRPSGKSRIRHMR